MDGCLFWERGEAHLHPKLAGTGKSARCADRKLDGGLTSIFVCVKVVMQQRQSPPQRKAPGGQRQQDVFISVAIA